MVTPTRNKNVGNTRSVGVHPFHSACSSAGNDIFATPLLTRIMNAMVIPRSTSTETSRFEGTRIARDAAVVVVTIFTGSTFASTYHCIQTMVNRNCWLATVLHGLPVVSLYFSRRLFEFRDQVLRDRLVRRMNLVA